MHVVRQQAIGFSYEGVEFPQAFRADLVVEACVLVELKVVDRLTRTHRTQLLTYLRLANFPVGLVLNFGAGMMKDGIKRLVNDLPPLDRQERWLHGPQQEGGRQPHGTNRLADDARPQSADIQVDVG